MKRMIRPTFNYGEWMVLPEEFPDAAIMMLLGGRYIVKEEYNGDKQQYEYIAPNEPPRQSFELKVMPDLEVPLPSMEDPKDLAILEMQERIKELESQLKRRAK